MAMTFGWKGVVDTDLQFSEFYSGDHTVVIWFLLQYPNAYAGPIFSVNGGGNYLVGQGDRNRVVKDYRLPNAEYSGPHLISRIEGAAEHYLPAAFDATFDAGQWYHLAVVRNGNQVRLFLNGQMLGSPLTLTNTDTPSGTLRLGRPSPATGVDNQEAQFYGIMDELAVYTRALTNAEISAQFTNHGHLTGNEPDLLAGWVFSPTPRTGLPPSMLRKVVHTGQTAMVVNSTNWSGSDVGLIPLPEHETMELPFLSGEAWVCGQGFAQAFSHRGYAAFCWDFLKADVGNGWANVYPNGSFSAPIYSTGGGTVTLVSDVSPPLDPNVRETENQVQVTGGDGFTRAYLHLLKSSVLVHVGQQITSGQPVAKICTEWRDAANRPVPHLHFAVNPNPNDMIGRVTVPTAFSNYELRNPDGSWSVVRKGIPIGGQAVRRRGFELPIYRFYQLTWAWIIILGGLMITPGGIHCIACGPSLTRIIGIISIAIGVAGFVVGRRG